MTLARGGRYLLTVGAAISARVSIDGALVHERRDFAGAPSTLVHVPVELAPGAHRVLVKLTRGSAPRSGLHVALSREDGAASDAEIAAPPARAPPAQAAPRAGAPIGAPAALAAALEERAGYALARLLAARDAAQVDREGAKALLSPAIARIPASAALRIARAAALLDDVTLDDQVGRARAEAICARHSRRNPANGEARVLLGEPAAIGAARRRGRGARRARAGRGRARRALEGWRAWPRRAARGTGRGARRAGARRERALRRRRISPTRSRGAGGRSRTRTRGRARRRLPRRRDEARRAPAPPWEPRGAAEGLAPVVAARPWSIEPALSARGRARRRGQRRRGREELAGCRRSGRAARASRRSSPTCESSRGTRPGRARSASGRCSSTARNSRSAGRSRSRTAGRCSTAPPRTAAPR